MRSSNFDRRIGTRHRVDGLPIGWYVGVPEDGDVTVVQSTGYLVDVSASGAAVVAPHNRDIWIGCIVGFEFRGLRGTVRIRRIDRAPADLDMRLYGIEFTAPSSDLVQGMCDTFLSRHTGLKRWRDPRYQAFDAPTTDRDAAERSGSGSEQDRRTGRTMPAAIDAGTLGHAEPAEPPAPARPADGSADA